MRQGGTSAARAGRGALETPLAPRAVRHLDVGAKAVLTVLLLQVLLDPTGSNLQDKGATERAVGYTAAAFALPTAWSLLRARGPFPWFADLLVTITCFTDVLGNRWDLYDSVEWFDDWMHFMNLGLLTTAVLLLTLPRTSSVLAVVERSLAFSATAAIAWEVAEYVTFLADSTERRFAYADTLSDLVLGVLGALFAATVVLRVWREDRHAGAGDVGEEGLEPPTFRV